MENPWVWRYFIRSKDRISGTPNNFVVQLPNPIPDSVTEVWVQVQSVSIDAYPNPTDASSVANQNSTSGNFNQPNFSSTNAYNNYGFDTGCGVDVCLTNVGTLNTIDTETITATNQYVTSASVTGSTATSITLPITNKTGICVSGPGYALATGDQATIAGVGPTMVATGFTAGGVVFQFLPTPGTTSTTWTTIASGTAVNVAPAQPTKTRADKTLMFVPYGRGDYERTLKLWLQPPWVKLNPSNLSYLNVKLFNDKGYPLKLKKFYANSAADLVDVNIDD
jgi:hypothetical protein